MKKLLIFQHIDCEHPGSLRQFLKQDGVVSDTVNFDCGASIPKLENYDMLWVMGGPMDVWETEENPWLIAEKEAIRRWVLELDKPYLGVCLGHQLLADALGGQCGRQQTPEIGILNIELNQHGMADPIFETMPGKQKCLQWHGVQVTQTPQNTVVLASSEQCTVQAMRVGRRAWSMQYHLEVEPDTVENWSKVPAYWNALLETIGLEGYNKMQDEAKKNMPNFLSASRQFYLNFMKTAFE